MGIIAFPFFMRLAMATDSFSNEPNSVYDVSILIGDRPVLSYNGTNTCRLMSEPPVHSEAHALSRDWDVGAMNGLENTQHSYHDVLLRIYRYGGDASTYDAVLYFLPLIFPSFGKPNADSVFLRCFALDFCDPWLFPKDSWSAVMSSINRIGRHVLTWYWWEAIGVNATHNHDVPGPLSNAHDLLADCYQGRRCNEMIELMFDNHQW